MPQSILRSKTIADTMTDTEKVSAIPPIPILYRDINNPAACMLPGHFVDFGLF
jgi:hypothetical protein